MLSAFIRAQFDEEVGNRQSIRTGKAPGGLETAIRRPHDITIMFILRVSYLDGVVSCW